MLDATAPPFDPVDLEPALRPFGQSRMLPRDAYTSQRVFAFEQERFFAGSWTCVGRQGDLEGTGAQRAVRVGRAGVLLARGADGRARAFANTETSGLPSTVWSSCCRRAGTINCSSTAPATPRRSPSTSGPSTTC